MFNTGKDRDKPRSTFSVENSDLSLIEEEVNDTPVRISSGLESDNQAPQLGEIQVKVKPHMDSNKLLSMSGPSAIENGMIYQYNIEQIEAFIQENVEIVLNDERNNDKR